MTKRNYPVGYGKPPTESQFKKGQSGNPRGRPKGSRNLLTLIEEDLGRSIPVTINGRSRKISKAEAIVMQLTRQALQGNVRAILSLVKVHLNSDYRKICQEAARDATDTSDAFEPDLRVFSVDELMLLGKVTEEFARQQRARAARQRDQSSTRRTGSKAKKDDEER